MINAELFNEVAKDLQVLSDNWEAIVAGCAILGGIGGHILGRMEGDRNPVFTTVASSVVGGIIGIAVSISMGR